MITCSSLFMCRTVRIPNLKKEEEMRCQEVEHGVCEQSSPGTYLFTKAGRFLAYVLRRRRRCSGSMWLRTSCSTSWQCVVARAASPFQCRAFSSTGNKSRRHRSTAWRKEWKGTSVHSFPSTAFLTLL